MSHLDSDAGGTRAHGRSELYRSSSFAVPGPAVPVAVAALGAALGLRALLGRRKTNPADVQAGSRAADATQAGWGAASQGAAAAVTHPPTEGKPLAEVDSDDSSEWDDSQPSLPELTPADIAAAALRLFVSRDDSGARGDGVSPRWLHHATRVADPALEAALEAAGWVDSYSCCRRVPHPRGMSTACLGNARRPVILLVAPGAAGDGYEQAGERICSLHRLLTRLCVEVFLAGLPAGPPVFTLYWDSSDPAMGFVDAHGWPYFNATHDPPDPCAVPGAAGTSAQPKRYKADRARTWLLAGCHLVAHTWAAAHDDALAAAAGEVVLHFSPTFKARFFLPKTALPPGRSEY